MRANGVPNFPDPNGQGVIQGSGIDPNSAAFQKATQACAKNLRGGKAPSPAQIASAEAAALSFSKCMRAHGVPDFPDPQFGSGGRVSIQHQRKGGRQRQRSRPQFADLPEGPEQMRLAAAGPSSTKIAP